MYGKVIYDPSKPEFNEEGEEVDAEDTEELEEEVPEVASPSTAEWKYTIDSTDPFCAVIKLTPLENAGPATLMFTDSEGNVEMIEEKDNEITLNLEEAVAGECQFALENISGRTFSVLYSTGDTYYGPEEVLMEKEPEGN